MEGRCDRKKDKGFIRLEQTRNSEHETTRRSFENGSVEPYLLSNCKSRVEVIVEKSTTGPGPLDLIGGVGT